MKSVLLAMDQGTTSSRAIVFDRGGRVLGVAQREFPQIYPQPGWVEHAPAQIWTSQLETAREALAGARVRPGDVAALGITNQRETTLLWDRRTGTPLCNAIVWQDRRTAEFCDALRTSGHEPVIREKTGLVLDAYFSASKLRWMLDHVEGARRRAERGELAFGTVDTWLAWNLSGGRLHITDPGNASRTMLYNIRTEAWDEELLRLFGIPPQVLPDVRRSSEIYGQTDAGVLGAGIQIGGIAGDQQAALFGQNCVTPGMVKNTYGTGCFMLMNTGSRPIESRNRLISTVAWRDAGGTALALEGSIFMAGAVVQWLRDGLGLIRSAADVEGLARSVPDTGGVMLVPAFAGLGAPHWDPFARGMLAGITRGTGAGHIARAALEGIAFQVADVLDAMREDSGLAIPELRVDGGAAANNLLMQMQADIAGVPVLRPALLETTALGAAALAGLACGCWSPEDIARMWKPERVFTPALPPERAAERRARWADAVRRASGWERPAGGPGHAAK